MADRQQPTESAAHIPLVKPDLGPDEEQAVVEVLRSGMLAMGDRTRALEQAWADYCGVGHAVFMANGTLALELMLRALDIGPGDEVITVSFSFNATVSAILGVGARPVLVDVRGDDYCIDPELVEAALTPRTRAVLPVHMYGLMADMAPLVDVCARHGLTLLEDAAQAVGASYAGRRAGSFGPAMFSLYATKNVLAGEGGMVTTNDGATAERLRLLRNHGMYRRYDHEALGTNAKPTDLAAAIALVQLGKLDAAMARRERNARCLSDGLRGYATPSVPEGRTHAWHQYTMRFPGVRDEVAAGLRERGIGCEIYYPTPIHRQRYIAALVPELTDADLPVTDRLASEVLSLPIRPNLTGGEIDRVIDAVRAVAGPA